jgi:hypothetical protein
LSPGEGRHNEPNFYKSSDEFDLQHKDGEPLIVPEIKSELFAYLGGLTRELKGKAYGINSTTDHVHLLISLPPVISISEALRFIKSNSSGWVHEKCRDDRLHGSLATVHSA